MRTAIMGAGAVGAYLGAMLARAGHPVSLIARGQNLTVLRRRPHRSGAGEIAMEKPCGLVALASFQLCDIGIDTIQLHMIDSSGPGHFRHQCPV